MTDQEVFAGWQLVPKEYAAELGEAGADYYNKFEFAHPLPAQWRWQELWEAMLAAAPQPAIPDGWQSKASRDVLAERRRQVETGGWTPEHDDAYGDGSMCMAAVCYAEWDHYERPNSDGLIPINWPWSAKWWKPRDRRRNLVKAAALLLAEIERLDRMMCAST